MNISRFLKFVLGGIIVNTALGISLNLNAAEGAKKSAKTVLPDKAVEECMVLQPNQKLKYNFESSAALDFNIHYHDGKEVFYPVKKDGSKTGTGDFKPKIKQDYCMMWANKTIDPITINYDFRVE